MLMMTCFIIIMLYWSKIVNTILWQYKFHVFMMYTSTCVSRKQFLGTVLLMSQSVLCKKCCKDLTPLIFVKIRYKIKNIKYLFGCFYFTLRLMIWRSLNVESDGDVNSQVWFLEDSNRLCLKRQLWKVKLFYRFLLIKGCTSRKK